MALISTKNIISPFTNKLHLTTIILFVIAFTILRLSGGQIELVKEGTKPSFIPNKPRIESGAKTKDTETRGNSLKDLEEMFQ